MDEKAEVTSCLLTAFVLKFHLKPDPWGNWQIKEQINQFNPRISPGLKIILLMLLPGQRHISLVQPDRSIDQLHFNDIDIHARVHDLVPEGAIPSGRRVIYG